MPQSNQHLVHALLLWTTILSLLQAVFIVLFFTAGYRGQNSNIVTPEPQFQPNSTPSPRLEHGEMMTFKATAGNSGINWTAKNCDSELVSCSGTVLKVNKDGHYFLSFQVTFKKCDVIRKPKPNVVLRVNNKDLLHGWINNDTCSTGFLGKTEMLSYPDNLTIAILQEASEIDESESLTHMDIIFIKRY